MLSSDAYAHDVSVENVQRGQMLKQNAFHLDQLQRREFLAGTQEMIDLTKNPWPPLGSPAYQQAIGTGRVEHIPGLLG
ncbi:hypothetical protein D3C84_1040300 [compost metagenome]